MTATKTARPSRGGRPAIGPQVSVSLPPEVVDRVDAAARVAGVTRSEWIRRTIVAALG